MQNEKALILLVFAKFLLVNYFHPSALGSARELETQLIINKEIEIIPNKEWFDVTIKKVTEVVALLVSTINKLKK